MRVAILSTGLTEWHGLHLALERQFPGHTFSQIPTHAEVDSDPDHFPYDGFTSNRLSSEAAHDPPENARDLVARAAQEALGDRGREAADLVVILDDLELPNLAQPLLVADVMRAAAQQHISGLSGRFQARTAQALRQRVSFHLAAPMIEAWFFADPGAIQRLMPPSTTQPPPAFPATQDPEAFQTDDPAYLAATEADCPCWISAGRIRKNRPKWLGDQRAQHPKGYLQWLCKDATDPHCTTYQESGNAWQALAGFGWGIALSRPSPQLQYLAALLDDLADRLGQAPATGPLDRALATATSLRIARSSPVLRNL